ncbi:unnamed protein product [Nippostrongylus brasiliensis]|uniref:PHB domain-containing protein n=1 Tax=Nippostrongylus brasiliensis TaxID=27835 RepID=A0A0N4YB02_NIPBR|nr:unnamed protein product [Nippostrongylus brasiliensis]
MLRCVARRVLSTAAARNPEAVQSAVEEPLPRVPLTGQDSTTSHLSLFPSPKVVIPTFEISRRVGTFVSQWVYQMFYEKAYSLERFVHAVNEGASVLGECIVNEEWTRMGVVASSELVEDCKLARQRFSTEQLSALRFQPNDIVLSFLHSSLISTKKVVKDDVRGLVTCIYFTVVSFIRKNDSVPEDATLSQLLNKFKDDVIVSNVT